MNSNNYQKKQSFNYKSQIIPSIKKITICGLLMLLISFYVEAQSISAGNFHSIASSEDGKTYKWGSKRGVTNYETNPFPVDISNDGAFAGRNIVAVSAGDDIFLALTDDGQVIYWRGPDWDENGEPMEAMDPELMAGVSNAVAIEGGGYSGGYILKADGTIVQVDPIQQVNGWQNLTNIVAISAFDLDRLIALKSDGSVYTLDGQVPGLTGIIEVKAGGDHYMVLKSDGTVYTWGSGEEGQLGTGNYNSSATPVQVPTLSGVVSIATGYATSYAVKADGTAYAWGNGNSGQLGDGVSMCMSGDEEGHKVNTPIQIQGLSNVKIITSKMMHCLAMDQAGNVYGWGEDFFNETGTEDGYYDGDYCIATPTMVNLQLIDQPSAKQGVVNWQQWTNLPSGGISTIPVATKPTNVAELNLFEAKSNIGNNYGSRVQGYVKAPQSGKYIFYIASDDQSELWLSTDKTPANKVKIASVAGNTGARQWYKTASQKSVEIDLVAGQMYFIEALHKENTGVDHLAVAWQLPDDTFEGPIPGNRLASYTQPLQIQPVLEATSPTGDFSTPAGAPVVFSANAYDPDGVIKKVVFYVDNQKIGEDYSNPYQATYTFPYSTYSEIVIRAFSAEGVVASESMFADVDAYQECAATGSIEREKWYNVPAGNLSAVPFNTSAGSKVVLNVFEAPSNNGNYYGSRISGYICPPATGLYVFNIASDDYSELWLSSNDDPSNKTKIAYVNGNTGSRQWNKYASQKSTSIYLTAGSKYYIEAVHKENGGNDNLAVAWTLPTGTFEGPIQGSHLSPYEDDNASLKTARLGDTDNTLFGSELDVAIKAYPNPFSGNATIQLTSIQSGAASLRVYDLSGNLVQRLFEGETETGEIYNFQFNSPRIPAGIYICRYEQGSKTINLKLVKM